MAVIEIRPVVLYSKSHSLGKRVHMCDAAAGVLSRAQL